MKSSPNNHSGLKVRLIDLKLMCSAAMVNNNNNTTLVTKYYMSRKSFFFTTYSNQPKFNRNQYFIL